MNIDSLISTLYPTLAGIRRDLHSHPELGYEEHRTSDLVANYLEGLGLTVTRGLGKTGVVATLHVGSGSRAIGLRADMDALPVEELNSFDHRSRHPGKMHACGHDGHTTLLLGAANILSKTRNFDGAVHFIFQPAEEMGGGGKAMLSDGLLERFPMDQVFALHNWPGLDVGKIHLRGGAIMAGADTFEIVIDGRGGHAAMPHQAIDVIVAGSALIQSLQILVARKIDPQDAAVVSVTKFNAGHAKNVLPDRAELAGTVRMFRPEIREILRRGLREMCSGVEMAFGVTVKLNYEDGYPPTINAEEPVQLARRVAQEVFGTENVLSNLPASMGSEDFAFIANAVPGCYAWLGNGPTEGGCLLHNPHYDFNDESIAMGVSYWVRLVESILMLRRGG
ncbi:MAG: M20 aminoacylase family protein [Sulfuritalea sp.]|nr:M20 aminoacylase family protein [Sulfuritalea sp.]